jgi:hypothetical protein
MTKDNRSLLEKKLDELRRLRQEFSGKTEKIQSGLRVVRQAERNGKLQKELSRVLQANK